ncbi:tyrosine-type recombinase/integrase [Leisingera sp. XS_AS12]|uniref:tyrosine-type recombinase/integrase n=1 Tax=Leisingera sp. XS_AS12 TaxID=3241294 RepID=UPI00351960E5
MKSPDRPKKLSLAFVRNVATPGKYYDRDGLILVVSAGGAKRWVQRLTIGGRRRDIGLGSAYRITPAAARRIAAKNRLLARAGEHPLAAPAVSRGSQEARPQTLARFVLNRFRRRKAEEKGAKAAREEYGLMRNHIHPIIGRRPVADLTSAEIRDALEKVRKVNPNVAKAARTRLIEILDEAVRDGFRKDNPADHPETRVLPAPKRTTAEGDKRKARVLAELPSLLQVLEASPRRPSLLRLIRFNLLTLRAPQECRLARWEQIDLQARLWRFPKMQAEGGAVVEFGLLDAHIAILEEARQIAKGGGTGWVFYNPQNIGAPYKANASYKAMRDLEFDIQVLDFRRAHEYLNRTASHEQSDLEAWLAYLQSAPTISS